MPRHKRCKEYGWALRRYKIGTFPVYDSMFDFLKSKSPIIFPDNNSSLSQPDYGSIKSLSIAILTYRPNKVIKDNYGVILKGIIPQIELRMSAIHERFEKDKALAKSDGRPLPEIMPEDLQDALLKEEACLDIALGEEAKLIHLRAELIKQESERSFDRHHGHMPLGHTWIAPDGSKVIDNHRVIKNSDGILIIEGGPYDGMLVSDYRELIVKPYRAKRKERSGKAVEIDGKKFTRPARARTKSSYQLPQSITIPPKMKRTKGSGDPATAS